MYMIHMRRAPLHRGTYQGSDAAREICGLRLSALFRSFFIFSLPFSGGPLEKYICGGNHDLRDTFLCTSISAISYIYPDLRTCSRLQLVSRIISHLASHPEVTPALSAIGNRTPA